MDIRQIRYLVAAVENGTLSAAARERFVTVQAVSKAISELETEVGAPLLTRTNHGVRPTALGSGFYRYAKEAIEGFERLEGFVSRASSTPSDDHVLIALSSPPFDGSAVALDRLAALISKRVGVHVDIILSPGVDVVRALDEGVVDAVCTIGEFESPETESIVIGSVPTGAVVRAGHPLIGRESVAAEDLVGFPVCWTDTFETMNRSAIAALCERGASFTVTSPARTDAIMPREVAEGDAFLFAVYLAPLSGIHSGFACIPLAGRDAIQLPLHLVSRKDSRSGAYQRFAACAADSLRIDSLL